MTDRPALALLCALAALSGVAAARAAALQAVPAPLAWSFPVALNDDGRGATQTQAAIAADGIGGLYAVWIDDRDGADAAVYSARRAPGAATWGPNARVAGGEAGIWRSRPAVAVDSRGQVHVVWSETRGRDVDILHSRQPAGASVWSRPERVTDDRPNAVQWSPRLVADGRGQVHAVWVDYRAGSADIYYSRRVGDEPWSANVRVNTPPDGDQTQPALAVAPGGELFAAWQDTRDGRADIYASRLPGGDVWWPNGRLSAGPERALRRDPAIAVESGGAIHAFWVTEGSPEREVGDRLSAATLRAGELFWDADRVVYSPARGALETVSLAGGPGGQTLAVWAETRPEGARIYSGQLGAGDVLLRDRVDAAPQVTDGRRPAVALDSGGRAHAVWQARALDGGRHVFYTSAALAPPAYGPTESVGWLQYRSEDDACLGDGYVTVACDGAPGRFMRPSGVDLTPFLGSYVAVSGVLVEDADCPVILAQAVHLRTPPCPRDTGAVTGILTDDPAPIAGAEVRLGEMWVRTGPTGRYFFDGVAPGAYALTATLRCALTASAGTVSVRARATTRVATGGFVRGEVISDCEVNLLDLVRVTAQLKARPPFHPPCADLDGDGTVSIYDLAIVGGSYLRTCPTPWQDAAATSRVSGPDAPASPGPTSADAAAGSGTRVRVDHDGAPPGAMARVRVALAGASPVRVWSAELDVSDAAALLDADPGAPGLQPFDPGSLPPGAWVVENEVAEATGRAVLTALVLAPAPELADGAPLGELLMRGSGGDVRVAGLILAGSDGRSVRGWARILVATRLGAVLALPFVGAGR